MFPVLEKDWNWNVSKFLMLQLEFGTEIIFKFPSFILGFYFFFIPIIVIQIRNENLNRKNPLIFQ